MISLIHSHLPFSFSSFRISSNKTHFSPSRLVSLLLLHFTYAYLCFYFHPKIVSNRSVDHDPSEVPHMLFDIKTTLNHMERLKAGTNTAIIIEKFAKNIWNKFILWWMIIVYVLSVPVENSANVFDVPFKKLSFMLLSKVKICLIEIME